MSLFQEDDRAAWNDFLLAYSEGNIDDSSRPDNIPNLDRYLQELGGWLAAPLRVDESERVRAFDRYSEDILQAYKDAGSDLKLDGYTRLAASLCDAPISLLNLLDSNTQWVTSEYGLAQWRHITLPRSHTFCAHTILRRSRDVFIVSDAKNDWRFRKMPMVCGEPHVQYYMGAPLTTSDGQNIGALCVLDTTSNRAEPTEKQKNGLIDLADTIMRELDLRADRLVARKAKQIFLSSISHELRSPLHGLMAFTDLMINEGHLTPFQEHCSKTIQNCGRSLCDVIDQVLSISDSQDISANKVEEVDLPGFLEEVVDATWAGKSQKKANASFEVTIDVDMTHLRHSFKINRGEIGRIIMNIFGNAIKYTDQGFLSIKLFAAEPAFHKDNRRLQHVTFVFQDSGKGIAKEFLPKMFVPFVQQDHQCEGFGLGMSLVKQLIDKNHGTIDVESEVNVGTTVTITVLLETIKTANTVEKVLLDDQSEALRGAKFSLYPMEQEQLVTASLRRACEQTFEMIHVDVERADVIIVVEEGALSALRERNLEKAIVVFASAGSPDPQHIDHLQAPVGPAKLGRALIMAITLHEQKLFQARRSSIIHLDPVSPPTSCAIKEFDPLTKAMSSTISSKGSSMDTDKSTTATSQSDLGSFTFGRPKESASTNHANPHDGSAKLELDKKTSHCPNCLCVDDNHINLQIMSALLSKSQVHFETAASGEAALDLVKSSPTPFDIIFMDVKMPGMDGIEAIKLIREHEANNKLAPATIIALTGCGPQDQNATAAAGADHFLKKPVSMKTLTQFVEKTRAL